ncbi:MAG: tetratricopeptide repeat protein [Zetaproteobacteria bacterium]|nr:tetratricopeptide repeat protein [Zetaproteobacteria bacterium]
MNKVRKMMWIHYVLGGLLSIFFGMQNLSAKVVFERTIDAQSVDGVDFSDVQDISISSNQLLLSTQKSLAMIGLKNYQLQHQYLLTGKGKVFDVKGISAVAALPLNRTLLVNRKENRWTIVNESGQVLVAIGHKGEQEGELSQPVDLVYSQQGRIYIVERGAQRVSVFSPDGVFLFSFGDTSAEKGLNLTNPFQIAVDQWDRVYVLDNGQGSRISIYSSKGELLKQMASVNIQMYFPKKPKLQALDVTLDGRLILQDKTSGKIIFLDWEKGKLLDSFGTKGQGRGQFDAVQSLEFDDASKKLFIADSKNKKVEVFQTDYVSKVTPLHADLMSVQKSSVLKTVCSISYIYTKDSILCLNDDENSVRILNLEGKEQKVLKAKFKTPKRASFNQNMLLILDKQNIKIFNRTGVFQFSIGKHGSKKGEFSKATDLAVAGRIYVADTGNHRIEVFSRNGVFFKEMGNGKNGDIQLKEPVAIAVDSKEQVYVADQGVGLIYVLNQQGDVTDVLGENNKKSPDFLVAIDDLMLDQNDVLYVLGSTKNNDKLIRVYRNGYPVFRFSPLHIQAQAGVDSHWIGKVFPKTNTPIDGVLGAANGAVRLLTGLAADTFGVLKHTFFSSSSDPWIFNPIPGNDELIAVMDPNKKARHTFLMLRVPDAVSNMHLGGDVNRVSLSWKKPSESFMGRYQVFADDNGQVEKKPLTEVVKPFLILPRKGAEKYRIVAVSAYGKHSKPSVWFEDAFQQGLTLYQRQDYIAAKQYFQQALNENSKHLGAVEYLGRTLIALGELKEAAKMFARLATFPHAKTRAYNLQAEALIQSQAWLQAKLVIDQAMNHKLANAKTFALCAQTLRFLDDSLGAIGCLQEASKLEPKTAYWNLELSKVYDDIGADNQSIIALQEAERQAGDDSQSWLLIGQAYEAKQQWASAAHSYQAAIDHDANNQQAHILLSGIYITTNNLPAARQAAIAMASIAELRGMANYVLGRVALKEGKNDRALALLLKAEKSDGQRLEVWLALADAYHGQKDFLNEQSALNHAINIKPKKVSLYVRLGTLCRAENNAVCAQKTFANALKLEPKNIEVELGLAQAYLNLNRPNLAEEQVNNVLSVKNNHTLALSILANAQSMQGRVSESIDTLQRAIHFDNNNEQLQLQLARAYMANHMYDQAEKMAEQAMTIAPTLGAPHAMLGDIYLARQMFEKAIAAFTEATTLESNNKQYRQKLNLTYLQKKKVESSGGGVVGPKLVDLKFKPAFAALYKQYASEPLGHVTLKNSSGIDFQNIKVSFQIKEYMDFPSTYVVDVLPAGKSVTVDLKASLNNKVLEIDENTGLQTEVSAEYFLSGSSHVEKLNQPITMYGRNAIVWNHTDMVGAFVTPKDQVLNVYIRQMVNQYKPKKNLLNDRISKAMTIFEVFHAMNMKYLIDPNNPYDKLSKTQADTVQYPRETLRVKSGDCDDLSVLMAASLENLGIETALLDVPGHLLMMFNTGLPEDQKQLISTQDDLLAIVDGKVWIPIEATLVGATFSEAWVEGAKKFQRYSKDGRLKPLYMHKIWQTVNPVTLPPANFKVQAPDQKLVSTLIKRESHILLLKAVGRLIAPYQNMLAFDAGNIEAQMQIAIIYAKNGLYEDAIHGFEGIIGMDKRNSAALNNLGNAYYLLKNYNKAIEYYQEAAALMPNNANVLVNIAMSYYQHGDVKYAVKVFKNAISIDTSVKTRYRELGSLLAG